MRHRLDLVAKAAHNREKADAVELNGVMEAEMGWVFRSQ
jgi:hypothetical protein